MRLRHRMLRCAGPHRRCHIGCCLGEALAQALRERLPFGVEAGAACLSKQAGAIDAGEVVGAQFLGAKLDGIKSAEQLFATNGNEIRKLVNDRRGILFSAYMTKTGHTRPGVPGGPGVKPGPSIEEANAKAADIAKQIAAKMGK